MLLNNGAEIEVMRSKMAEMNITAVPILRLVRMLRHFCGGGYVMSNDLPVNCFPEAHDAALIFSTPRREVEDGYRWLSSQMISEIALQIKSSLDLCSTI